MIYHELGVGALELHFAGRVAAWEAIVLYDVEPRRARSGIQCRANLPVDILNTPVWEASNVENPE
jgi:hypothetical protein